MDNVQTVTNKGFANPLGSTVMSIDGQQGVNFAIFSQNASAVYVCIFDDDDQETIFELTDRTGYIWHGFIAKNAIDIGVGTRYGFRVDGETDIHQGRIFNVNKLLCDPYAKALEGHPQYGDAESMAWFHYSDGRDNAALAPKSIVIDHHFDWADDQHPNHDDSQLVIYEASAIGFSRLHPDIPQDIAGTFLGLSHPAAIEHLTHLGVTAVELLPITYHLDEPHLQTLGLSNYWGYNTLGHFAVDARFATDGSSVQALQEFKTMVKALHAAGIEVIMDIVFNHTVEQSMDGPMLCQKGIDSASYYWWHADGYFENWTGCGNTINASHRAAMRWVLDSLRYWVNECHVDGFRFDLATQLGRKPGFSQYAPVFTAIYQDPDLNTRRMIAEPWDLGEGGYQLGNFPNEFLQWNDRFRDDMREFWLHESGNLNAFRERFAGSRDIFQHNNMTPSNSVNFITAHDGFCLQDLVSYNERHNQANGEDNRDGHANNLSYNHGVEGQTDDEAVLTARARAANALLASLILSNGTPMLLAGDAIGHTQQGNNNTYCQNNEISWLNWAEKCDERVDLVKHLIELRREISRSGAYDNWWGEKIYWRNVFGEPMQAKDWSLGHESKAMQLNIQDKWVILINAKRAPEVFSLSAGNWVRKFGDSEIVIDKERTEVHMPNMGLEVYARE